jgi:hypothetical protein
MALKAGDVETAFLHAELEYRHPPEEIDAFARSLRSLDSIKLDVSWSYLRTTRLGRKQRPETETLNVTVDCRPWKRDVLYAWAIDSQTEHLVELAGERNPLTSGRPRRCRVVG